MASNYSIGFGKTENEIFLKNLPILGKIPDWLQGTLIRNGPGTFEVGSQKYRHWFDGLAMLHRFFIDNGNITYSNKFLQCNAYHEAKSTGKISYSEFATDPCRSLFQRVTAVFNQKITDSAKVNIAKITGRFLALGETPIQIEFDPQTLHSIGVFNYEKKLKQHVTTVHPHFDFTKNEAYNLVTHFHKTSHYRIYKIIKYSAPEIVCQLPVKHPAYLHSFGMSKKYFIIAEFPFVVSPLKLLFQVKPFIENYKWKPGKGTTFYIFDRNTGELTSEIKTDAFFAFHHINAYEDEDQLIIDINAYPDAEIINSFYLNCLTEQNLDLPSGEFRRYNIDLKSKQIKFELISDECLELARFDYERFNMNGAYRYVYGVSVNQNRSEGFYNQLVKIDVQKQQTVTWFEENCYPGEPVFVGKPMRKLEDQGILLSVVLNSKKGKSFLLILDAQNFQEIARAQVPQPILFGYHGAFF